MSAVVSAQVIAQATRASGVIVQLEPRSFVEVLHRSENPLVVTAVHSFFGRSFQYLTSHKGLAFYTKSPEPLSLPSRADVVKAKSIWVP